jgi:polysaccharide biosynthesis transport protein
MNETLASYLEVLRRRWRMVAAATLISIGVAACYFIFAPAKYMSSAVLFVSTPSDDPNSYYFAETYSTDRLNSYAALGRSPEIAQRVINDVGLDTDPSTLVGGTRLIPLPGTVLLRLTTMGQTPREAQAIANAYIEEFRRTVDALETVPGALNPRAELITVQTPTADSTRALLPVLGQRAANYPVWMIICGVGGVGLILGAFGAVLTSLLDGRIRRPQDAAEATDAPVLAEFASSSVPWDGGVVDPSAGESARALRTAIDRLQVLEQRVIMLASAEPGVGKTCIGLSLCRVLADRGSSVTLVDFDARGSRLASALDLDADTPTVEAIVSSLPGIAANGREANGRHHQPSSELSNAELPPVNWNGITVIPFGPPEPDPGATADHPGVVAFFELVRERYDWVVVDTPAVARFSDATRLARHADAVLLIAHAGKTKFDELRMVAAELTRADGHIAGLVFVTESRWSAPRQAPDSTAPVVQSMS